jgi:predicted Fe-Mo cluster-binding NifX family protein
MKVVVTSTGEALDAKVDSRFARATCFLMIDTEKDGVEVVDNSQDREAMQGAGVLAAQKIAGLEPDYVITGHCGPNAFALLKAAGIKVVVGVEGTVREAVEQLKRGDLQPTGDADVEGHWG